MLKYGFFVNLALPRLCGVKIIFEAYLDHLVNPGVYFARTRETEREGSRVRGQYASLMGSLEPGKNARNTHAQS